jgi:hypothetical protein
VRTFASSALRAKEVAGPESDTPNMRVRYITGWGWNMASNTTAVCSP